MLVVSNGAFKSGSTWLFNILRCLTEFAPPPKPFLHPKWVNPSVPSQKLANFLNTVDYQANHYLFKSHFAKPQERDLLLAYPQVYVLNIRRDLRDVAVSAYYHDCRKNNFSGECSDHYWSIGRFQIYQVCKHHCLWDLPAAQVLTTSYEGLHQQFAEEVRAIAQFLHLDITPEIIEKIRCETSLEQLRETYGEANVPNSQQFFRKGKIGDWQQHFDEAMLKDIAKIEAQGISRLDRLGHKIYQLSVKLLG